MSGAAIVTGGTQGIGFAVANRLGRVQPVTIVARTADRVHAAERALFDRGINALGIVADVSEEEDARRAVAASAERFGGVQTLINNAAIGDASTLPDVTVDHWDGMLGVNLRGPLLLAREVAPLMGSDGRIVNVSSVAAILSEPGYSAYSASKAGVISLTKSLAVELAERGIMVNCVAPGWVRTPMTEEYLRTVDRPTMLRFNLLGRPGLPEEIAEVVAFLASPSVTYLTGQTICVDGGQSIMGDW